jgi:hypothetical protein
VALWKLTVRDVELPGLWVVIDREFRPAQCGGPGHRWVAESTFQSTAVPLEVE